jgi:hypothetical protein
MAWIMPETVVQKLIQNGMDKLRQNPDAFQEIFATYLDPELEASYGQSYIDKIQKWFFETKIPVVQAWALNPQRVPCYSIHLANEQEDESKSAMGDFYGQGEDFNVGVASFSCYVDIGVHADRSGDHVLWLYYILSYILFKEKLIAERMGLRLHSYSASDYSKDAKLMTENIWTRWVRFRCTTLAGWDMDPLVAADAVEMNIQATSSSDPDDSDPVDI